MNSTVEEQAALLMQGSEFGDPEIKRAMAKELQERLSRAQAEGRSLRVYCGYDATRPDLHLGHTITLRKLRQFQELGHEVTFLIGDFTTRVADPSDQHGLRPQLEEEQIRENARTYAQQAYKILDPDRTRVRYNSEWLSTLSMEHVLKVASTFTVGQFLARDSFRKRSAAGDPIWLHELLYALLQGYDAVAMRADVQLGGTEQLFNLLAGRKLQEAYGQEPQVCITFPILVGIDGQFRMSKSTGNYVGIDEAPEVIYGKVMSIPDHIMLDYFRLVTRWTPDQVAQIEADLAEDRLHPMEAKKQLAWELVDCYHGSQAADAAAGRFERVHQRRELPEEMPEMPLDEPMAIPELLVVAGLCDSKSEARRLVQQGGVRIDGELVESIDQIVAPGEKVLQAGRRRFVRLVLPE